MKYVIKNDINGNKYVEVSRSGYDLINHPMYNKASAFTDEERNQFELDGLLPKSYFTLEQRLKKIYSVFKAKSTNLEKHIFLRGLQDRNEVMFYALLNYCIEEALPIVYTPTVGDACQHFSEIYRKPRGLFISYPDRDRIDEILSNTEFDDTAVIVVTDGERILGLGDLGAGGMGIPVGKLSLYTAIAGIAPYKTLPIVLDVGTDNEDLLDNPEYVGWAHKRIRGKDYDDFIELFIQAVKRRFPKILLQFEDFAQANAFILLEIYSDLFLWFNDDIQGTATIVVGALLSAINASGVALKDHRIVVCGAGSAGVGISNLIVDCLVHHGIDKDYEISLFFLVDRYGLITDKVESLDFQKPFIKQATGWNVTNPDNITLLETVKNVKATMLLGVSGQFGIFNQEVVSQMAENTQHPIIFPISNPTSKAEAIPEDVMKWTSGRALVGTGSPFPPISRNGKQMRVDQVNNSYIFPAVGLGILAIKSRRVTTPMFLAAAVALAEMSPAKNDVTANLLPELSDIHKVAKHIAFAVAKEAVKSDLSDLGALNDEQIQKAIDDFYWVPEYIPYRRV